MLDITTDGHVHTRLCHHARGEMEEYVLAAIAKGLERIVFLEHLESGINYFESTWLTEEDFLFYFQEGKRLRAKYESSIAVSLGVEVGYNPAEIAAILGFLERFQWDSIGISYHFLENNGRHYNLVSRKKHNLKEFSKIGVDRVATAYFSHLLEAVKVIPGTVVCHLDAVLRYHPDFLFTSKHLSIVRDIFQVMLERDIALEVNTSGYRLRQEPFPSIAILKEAVRSGLKLVAGSDAHTPNDVSRCFDRLAGIV